ncbi:uncharacterized protein [Amphiura filiformis]|uniref:uncharacterized protein isoform X2 n=1 Tax=Amphiura filiformis TaxID=82378 RepID=UPI003B21D8A9
MNDLYHANGGGAAAEEENDDDWGDFGGFETAPPPPVNQQLADVHPAGLEASPSPWASFPIAPVGNSASDKPDLLMARSQPQSHQHNLPQLDPLADPFPGAGRGAPELASQAEASLQQQAQQQAQAEGASVKSSLDALDVSLDDDVLLEAAAAPPQNNINRPGGATAASPNGGAQNEARQMPDRNDVLPDLQSPARTAPPIADNNNRIVDLEERLSAADREKLRLQKDRDDLMQRLQDLENEVEGHRLEVAQQKQRYDEIQTKHAAELEEIRKAGHDALAVIVEEYKELCKCAVAQQQEASERHVQEAITKEAQRCEQLLKEQHDRLTQVLEEERQKSSEIIQQALDKQVVAQKAALEECLLEERNKNKQALDQAVQDTQSSCHETLQKALEEERSKGKGQLEAQTLEGAKALEDEREQHRKTMTTALEEERQRSKDAIQTALLEERKHQQEVIKQSVEKTKEEMQEYIKEQKRMDAAVRHRSLASLDLFLESARQQLKSLMEDKPIGEENQS